MVGCSVRLTEIVRYIIGYIGGLVVAASGWRVSIPFRNAFCLRRFRWNASTEDTRVTRRCAVAVTKAGSVTGRVVGGCCDSISVEARQADRAPARTGCSLFRTSYFVFRAHRRRIPSRRRASLCSTPRSRDRDARVCVARQRVMLVARVCVCARASEPPASEQVFTSCV